MHNLPVTKRLFQREWAILGGLLLAGLGLRLYLLTNKLLGIGSDEAVVGLMARHILQGERPFFYYGQSYYGPLDAYLTSLLFAVFEPNDFALRIVPLAASLLFVIVIYCLGKALYSRQVGLWGAAYVAIAPAFLLVRGLKGDAAYSLVLLISALALLVFYRLMQRFSYWRLGGLIGLCVLGLWVFPLMLYTIGAIGLTWVFMRLDARRKSRPAALSTTIRQRPLWLGMVAVGVATLVWLGRDQMAVQNFLSGARLFMVNALPILMGFLPPVEGYDHFLQLIQPYPPLVTGVVVVLCGCFLVFAIGAGVARFRQGNRLLFVYLTLTMLVFGLFFSLINITPSIFSFPRYLFPLYCTIPLWVDAAMRLFRNRRWLGALAGVVVFSLNIFSNLAFLVVTPPAPEVLSWVESQPTTQYVYIHYLSGYWLAFESQEKAIPFIAEGIQPGYNRYEPYADQVRSASSPVYALPTGSREAGDLTAILKERGIEYQVEQAGAYQLFHDLSAPIQIIP